MTRSVLSSQATARNPVPRYVAPDLLTRRVLNPLVAAATRLGLPLAGSRVLAVRGRSSGQWRTTPVNPLTIDGVRYLVAPRGDTQWVRNLRAAGAGELRWGRRSQAFTAVEVPGADKPPLLREYLRRWAWEVGMFFDGVDADASDAQLLAAGPKHPVFRITTTPTAP
ncbi:deazaflavin-dependent oxidoreductase (nitroreductase family) [Kineococcus radiotolerans]|uniref:Deazaflavin-dependent oxidoreductase (Nitroreductase family) n=1 Tax=Kineococcus radiotolerans TaxID=131568 RepID=A0A7W4XV13_KINRA|nr:nitroreductase family deazaflavin-dependent oxidoreductase [Kineococcus radiotolerans]MBB2899313.1 deazaflavin-dependent oxidoreductase (nitroreductase family) [Kineococcus radiotolerans]